MSTRTTPEWLRERNNDPFGTPPKHPFWEQVAAEKIGAWKLFAVAGTWYGYDTRHNAWYTFTDEADARERTAREPVDPWA
jgi:hypothetical protein